MVVFLVGPGGTALAWSGDANPTTTPTQDCTVGGDANNEPPSCVFAKPFGNADAAVAWQYTGGGTPNVTEGFRVYRTTNDTLPLSSWTLLNPGALVKFFNDGRAIYGFLDTGPLRSSTTYYYSVASYESGVESPGSYQSFANTRPYSTVTTPPPRPVRGLSIADNGDGSVTLSWQANPEPNVTQYKIYRAQKSTGVKDVANLIATVSGTSTTVSGLSYYQDYYFVVTAYDGTAEGVPSVVRWVMPRPNDPQYYNGSLSWAPPHGSYMDDTNKCTICHGIHSAPQPGQPPSYLLKVDLTSGSTVASLCFTCHDGTGSNRMVKTEFDRSWDSSSSETGDANLQGKSTHPVLQASAADPAMPDANGRDFYGLQLKCTNCHSAHLQPYTPADTTTETPRLLSPRLKEMTGQQPFFRHKGEGVCYTCHGNGALSPANANGYNVLIGQPRETPFEDSAHKKFIRSGAAVSADALPLSGAPAPTPTLIRCLGCHKPHGSPNARLKILDRPYVCFNCHGPAGNSPIYHVDHSVDGTPNSIHEVVYDTTGANQTVVTGLIQNTPPDIYSLIAANPTDADTRHDMWPAGDDPAAGLARSSGGRDPLTAITCTNCHNPHTVQAPSQTDGGNHYPIHIDPYNPSPTGVWSGANDLPFSCTGTGGTNYPGTGATAVIGFCWRCHDGPSTNTYSTNSDLPSGSNTLPWAPAPSFGGESWYNVARYWCSNNEMGYQDNIATTPAGSPVNGVSSIDWSQFPSDGAGGVVLPCTVCHDPHGSPNPYRLKPFIRLKLTNTECANRGLTAPCYETKGPLIVYRFSSSSPPPPVDIDARFFCGACHDRTSMGFIGGGGMVPSAPRWFPEACTRCHAHGITGSVWRF